MILVVDKDKLECLPSQQNELVRTVKDLHAAQIHAHVSVPLIVVVNKVCGNSIQDFELCIFYNRD